MSQPDAPPGATAAPAVGAGEPAARGGSAEPPSSDAVQSQARPAYQSSPSQRHLAPPRRLGPLVLGALGIVYGDIGTSPLYAVKECFAKVLVDGALVTGPHSLAVSRENVLGILSLVFWSLVAVVTVKYLLVILRADNKGEGGIFALLALVPTARLRPFIGRSVVLAAIFGAALLYGDGVITPAISVLSAVEGLGIATHAAERFVVPLTVVILLGLFLIQSRGTGKIGRLFGPVMALWFGVIAGLGVWAIAQNPAVLAAVNPAWGVRLFTHAPWHAFVVLGSVVLCVTGGEALYADMGHFGRRPIRISWLTVVFPALALNYFGQGAYLLEHGWVENPFYALAPRPVLYPMVALATLATIIASQAMISGAFSITRQAVQLGYMPRMTIVHTSADHEGQIFLPELNKFMMVTCLALVFAFKSSGALVAAYGIAVTGTMTITSLIFYFVARYTWGWGLHRALPLLFVFLTVDLAFFLANLLKFFDGGWFPIAVAVGIFALMATWKRGRAELGERFAKAMMPLEGLLEDLEHHQPHRVRGTAVFMSGNSVGTPPVLLHHLKHNQVLHRQIVLLSIVAVDVPTVARDEQLDVKEVGNGFFRVVWQTGFMETPSVPKILLRAREKGLVCEPSTTSYFLGRETLLTSGKSKMSRWRKALFAFVSRNALPATSYFGLPPGRVVELGMQVDL